MTVGTTDLSSAYALWEPAGAIVPDKPGGLFLRLPDRFAQLGRDLCQDQRLILCRSKRLEHDQQRIYGIDLGQRLAECL